MNTSNPCFSAAGFFQLNLKLVLSIASLLALSARVDANTMVVDPGPAGSSSSYISGLFFNGINGSVFNGQTESWNIIFANNDFLVSGNVGIDLDINQSGSVGTWPSSTFTISAYLIDAMGNPVSAAVNLGKFGVMPAQIWPGWPYQLPDGTAYLPETTMYQGGFPTKVMNITESGYYLAPIIFSGIHFDVTYPDDPTETALGGRLGISGSPTYVSPDSTPVFYVNVPDSSPTLLLLTLGLAAVTSLSRRFQT
jgi:hypothetical protein